MSLAKKISEALSQEHYVDVKWKVKRGWSRNGIAGILLLEPSAAQELGSVSNL